MVHELVDPIGVLHVVPDADLQAFCARHGLGRPDNVARLSDEASKWRFSQNWQALKSVRWLKFVHKKSLTRVEGVPLQPVLGETGYFLKHVACNNLNMVDGAGRVVFREKEFSRLLGKSPPPQYKCWARATPTLEEAREYFGCVHGRVPISGAQSGDASRVPCEVWHGGPFELHTPFYCLCVRALCCLHSAAGPHTSGLTAVPPLAQVPTAAQWVHDVPMAGVCEGGAASRQQAMLQAVLNRRAVRACCCAASARALQPAVADRPFDSRAGAARRAARWRRAEGGRERRRPGTGGLGYQVRRRPLRAPRAQGLGTYENPA